MQSLNKDAEERSNLAGSNMFEMLLFRLGTAPGAARAELFGINVFKIREIVAMPPVTAMAGSPPHVLGVVNLRGQVIPVIDLPSVVGCVPAAGNSIMLVTEFARTTQAFAVEAVEDIVRLEWSQVMAADANVARGLVTSIARIEREGVGQQLAQVLDVESILGRVMPKDSPDFSPDGIGAKVVLRPGTVVLAADDSFVARSLIEQELKALGLPYVIAKSGKEAWDRIKAMQADAESKGQGVRDRIALVLTDLEMPEMDGFTLTRNIKQDAALSSLPVVIHSSLSGTTNEEHVRSVGADAYVGKFAADELAETIRAMLAR